MSLLEQAPCFATDKHFVAMNSHKHHVLHKPNLQDLRRLKFTKNNLFRRKLQLHEYTNVHEWPRRANVSTKFSPKYQPSVSLLPEQRIGRQHCCHRCCHLSPPHPSRLILRLQ
jgi:hypothetical protein